MNKPVGYQQNEWLAVYVDEFGDRQIIAFDLYEQAMNFLTNVRKSGTCVIGVMTTRFYDKYVERIIEKECD